MALMLAQGAEETTRETTASGTTVASPWEALPWGILTVVGIAGAIVIGAVVVIVMYAKERHPLQQGQRSWLDYGAFFIVSLGILTVFVAYLVTLIFADDVLDQSADVLAFMTALFGVVGTLVGAYFGVKASADARAGAERLATATAPPTITITTPANGAQYTLNEVVAAEYECRDASGAPVPCTGPVANGQPIDTGTPGTHYFTVTSEGTTGARGSLIHAYIVAQRPTPS